MKKIFLLAVMLCVIQMQKLMAENTDISSLENVIYVAPQTVSSGAQTKLVISMKNTAAIRGFQFNLYLPEGVTVAKNSGGRILSSLNADRLPEGDEHTLTSAEQPDGSILFLCGSQYDETFVGNDGEILSVTINIPSGLSQGDYPVILKDVQITETDISKFYNTEIVESTLTIGAPADTRIVFDETSNSLPTLPTPATNVDVRVKRTIKANEWSTICLPFAMTGTQVKGAFGEDVQLAELKSWEEVDDDVIEVTFSDVAAIEANTPYVLKVSKEITEFTVDGVDVDPEDEPAVTMGKMNRGTFGSFTGSYVPVLIDEECLFLSDNKFWYSTGKTRMKGYRAYFYFQTVLSVYSGGEAKVRFFIDGTATNIEGISSSMPSDAVYNISGVRMNSKKALPKGLYIVDGKKVIIK